MLKVLTPDLLHHARQEILATINFYLAKPNVKVEGAGGVPSKVTCTIKQLRVFHWQGSCLA